MTRTTVVLPESLKAKAMRRARGVHISFGELVRRSLERELEGRIGEKAKEDPFWDDTYLCKAPCPKDLSSNVDKYLYEEET